jgi:hypothetical protein
MRAVVLDVAWRLTVHTIAMAGPAPSRPSWTSFGMWAIVGAGVAFGVLSVLSIGVFVLAGSALFTIMVVRWRGVTADAGGLVSGAALPLFSVSFLNRQGPGTVCTSIPGGTSCTDEWNPWPWLVAGIVLMAAGLGVFLQRRGRFSHISRSPSRRA